ncbi:MAG: glycosyltransferase family 9 protein, partial [bacterium]|nr:glycosyltransferase family 9 protein [Candidatus Kapabacteria bacterium]
STVRRVLLLRYDAIGDMITTLPTIRTLKRLNPDIEVDVMASPKNRRVVENDPNVTRILELRNRPDQFVSDILKARRVGYDVVICCIFGKATKIGIIANWIGGTRAIKTTIWRGEKYGRFFNLQSKSAQLEPSMWDKMLRLIPETFRYELQPGDEQPYIAVDAASREDARRSLVEIGFGDSSFIAINITSVNERNRWPSASFRKLIEAILAYDHDIRIVLLWMGNDRTIAEQLANNVPSSDRGRIALYPATRNVMEIVAVVEQSEAVFSLDTGVVHMASATGRPVMALYVAGSRAITEWRPYGVPYRAIESDADKAFVATIPPERVIPVFLGLLDEIRESESEIGGREIREGDEKNFS